VYDSSVLLLNSCISVVVSSLQMELALNKPSVVIHIVNIEVLVSVVPTNNIKEVVVVENVV